jgi:hypothetical protein
MIGQNDPALDRAIQHFQFAGRLMQAETYGFGHINQTFAVRFHLEDGKERRYILQHINKSIFTKPVELMENIRQVTFHVRQSVQKAGGNPDRESLTLIPAVDGAFWYLDPDGEYWRAFIFIEKTICLQKSDNQLHLFQAAQAFGRFQRMLADFPAGLLHETIPGFHHTPGRLARFLDALKNSTAGRAAAVEPEIDFVLQRKSDMSILADALSRQDLPLRVTHNDTKLNNVLLDESTGCSVCVIDLDTVMPGLVAYDYGDLIRFAASTADEDEKNLDLVKLDLAKLESITRGFIAGTGHTLTNREVESLPWGARLMTLECGMRFLTDHLNGDVYFKIHYPGQNLDRCRTQFKLVHEMEQQWNDIKEIMVHGNQ